MNLVILWQTVTLIFALFLTFTWIGKLVEFYIRGTLKIAATMPEVLSFILAVCWAVFIMLTMKT